MGNGEWQEQKLKQAVDDCRCVRTPISLCFSYSLFPILNSRLLNHLIEIENRHQDGEYDEKYHRPNQQYDCWSECCR